jgi:hypothetical protein
MQTDKQIFEWMTNSDCYRALNAIDRNKVMKKLKGDPAVPPKSNLAKAAFYLAERIHIASGVVPPNPPKPPPVLSYKRVAPITVRQEGGSDQRVCIWAGAPGDVNNLQPGVVRLENGQYTDDSGALYRSDGDGLEDSSIRSKVEDARLVGARSMDGRSACECPTVGEPTKNTGSWTV